jgi:hypothetical protein
LLKLAAQARSLCLVLFIIIKTDAQNIQFKVLHFLFSAFSLLPTLKLSLLQLLASPLLLMPSITRICWSDPQRTALKEAKQELRAFLDDIDYAAGENRHDLRGKEMKSVISVRDGLVKSLMRMTNSTGDPLFLVETTQVRMFILLECWTTQQVLAERVTVF